MSVQFYGYEFGAISVFHCSVIMHCFQTLVSDLGTFLHLWVRLCFLRPNSEFSNVVRAKRCCVHAYFRINVVSKRRFKTPKNVRLRSWLEQNADSGGSINAKSHITTFK